MTSKSIIGNFIVCTLAVCSSIAVSADTQPFTYLEGKPQRYFRPKPELTVLTCQASSNFDADTAAELLETNADIICIQELSSEADARALHEALKDRYAHFYVHFEETPEKVGLLVASRYFIHEPRFTPFSSGNAGIFDGLIGRSLQMGHLYVANVRDFGDTEEEQDQTLSEIRQRMRDEGSHALDMNVPSVLCCDWGIEMGHYDHFNSSIEVSSIEKSAWSGHLGHLMGVGVAPENDMRARGVVDPNSAGAMFEYSTENSSTSATVSVHRDSNGNLRPQFIVDWSYRPGEKKQDQQPPKNQTSNGGNQNNSAQPSAQNENPNDHQQQDVTGTIQWDKLSESHN